MGIVSAEKLNVDTLNTEPLSCGTLRLMLAYCGLTPGGMSAQAVAFMMVADEPGLGSVLGHEHDPAEVVEVRVDAVCDDNDEKLCDDNDEKLRDENDEKLRDDNDEELRDDNDEEICDVVPDDNAKELCDVFDEDTDDALTLIVCEDVKKSLV